MNEHREPVPIGMPGEIWIGGAGVAVGYHDRPELTAERFAKDQLSSAQARECTAPVISRDGAGTGVSTILAAWIGR